MLNGDEAVDNDDAGVYFDGNVAAFGGTKLADLGLDFSSWTHHGRVSLAHSVRRTYRFVDTWTSGCIRPDGLGRGPLYQEHRYLYPYASSSTRLTTHSRRFRRAAASPNDW